MYGLISILDNLGIDSIAEFVCNVVNTKCPVNAAFIAISAVSFDLVSQIRIISGSCLRIDLSPTS
jgi:hypothetical protein